MDHHCAGLAHYLGDAALARELAAATIQPASSAQLTARERALCDYAAKLTNTPADMVPADLEPLREVGLDDAAILELNQIVAYFAYANRTVLGLGVTTDGDILGLHPDENQEGFQHH